MKLKLVPVRSKKRNTTTLMAMMASTIGVGLVEPTTPLRPRLVCVKAGTWRERFAPSLTQAGHCHPTGAGTMQSVQMGRRHRAHCTAELRSGCA